jgi:hypothetical protein
VSWHQPDFMNGVFCRPGQAGWHRLAKILGTIGQLPRQLAPASRYPLSGSSSRPGAREWIGSPQEGAGAAFADRLGAAARAYVGFAVANAALLDLMFSAKHSPQQSEALGPTVHRWSDQLLELIGDGQRRGEVHAGPLERIALPIFAALHGYADLTVSGMLPTEAAEYGLDDVITSILRGCAPQ